MGPVAWFINSALCRACITISKGYVVYVARRLTDTRRWMQSHQRSYSNCARTAAASNWTYSAGRGSDWLTTTDHRLYFVRRCASLQIGMQSGSVASRRRANFLKDNTYSQHTGYWSTTNVPNWPSLRPAPCLDSVPRCAVAEPGTGPRSSGSRSLAPADTNK